MIILSINTCHLDPMYTHDSGCHGYATTVYAASQQWDIYTVYVRGQFIVVCHDI